MKRWQFTQAKARLSAVVDAALGEGPQEITVATKAPVVLVAARDFARLTRRAPSAWRVVKDLPRLDDLAEVLDQLAQEERPRP
jgi:prevent-host-death family protein